MEEQVVFCADDFVLSNAGGEGVWVGERSTADAAMVLCSLVSFFLVAAPQLSGHRVSGQLTHGSLLLELWNVHVDRLAFDDVRIESCKDRQTCGFDLARNNNRRRRQLWRKPPGRIQEAVASWWFRKQAFGKDKCDSTILDHERVSEVASSFLCSIVEIGYSDVGRGIQDCRQIRGLC